MAKLQQGLWLVGEYDGANERTVAPREGGKVFTPFVTESVRLLVNDEERYVEWREGKRPPIEDLVEGESVVVGVRPGKPFADGTPRWDGRAVPIVSNE